MYTISSVGSNCAYKAITGIQPNSMWGGDKDKEPKTYEEILSHLEGAMNTLRYTSVIIASLSTKESMTGGYFKNYRKAFLELGFMELPWARGMHTHTAGEYSVLTFFKINYPSRENPMDYE